METNKIAVHLPTKEDFETFKKYCNEEWINVREFDIEYPYVLLERQCRVNNTFIPNNNYTIITVHDYIKQFCEVIEVDETPDHYNTGTFDVIDFCNAYKLSFNRGNVVKYVARAGKKGSELEDLEKALDYIKREIKFLKDGCNGSDN